jgi:Flp pilus assembly pilin Flp
MRNWCSGSGLRAESFDEVRWETSQRQACSEKRGQQIPREEPVLPALQLINNLTAWAHNREEEGQTLVEYALIIALLSVALIASLTLLKNNIANVFDSVSAAL